MDMLNRIRNEIRNAIYEGSIYADDPDEVKKLAELRSENIVDMIPNQSSRDAVQWFSTKMEERLKDNDHKGGWKDCDPGWLLGALNEEIVELEDAMQKGDKNGTIKEAADVANFAMMIADLLVNKFGK